jgi:hypothetical protein
MRIGIDAGEVLTDLERVEGPRDRMLTGDAVSTADDASRQAYRTTIGSRR